ncbi:MAG TPA: hypothetical protein VNQ90_15610 [Chthoniobacteraceae bacterium]|nr:hypothetical protein [Chthoniobacteraceae bacterium]
MIAPSIDDLYRVEDDVEKAIKSILERDGIAPVYVQQDSEVLTSPRVEVQLQLGAATGHKHIDRQKRVWIDAWNGTLVFQIVTRRKDEKTKLDPFHSKWRAAIRRIMQGCAGSITTHDLPYHGLPKITEQGTTPKVESEDKVDISEVAFSVLVCIRPSAWP